jgi:pimeloyl-ACP methyl ester carboxylesterase
VARIFYLHALGASAAEWDDVIRAIEPEIEHVPLDLPGFGGSADADLDVAALVDWFAERVGEHEPRSWAVVGHSMGGKIATLAAARARDGDPAFTGLAAVVLLAASPPSPEPMEEERRADMIGWFDDGRIDAAEAATFVDANTAHRLPDDLRDKAIVDVDRSGRQAWVGWLERGSREDWAESAGVIAVPALIVAGEEDGDLGVEAQRRLNLPHYADARIEVVAGAAHLLPYEQPARVAALIREHVRPAFARALPGDFTALLASDRVSRRTRAVMTARHAGPTGKGVLTERQRGVLAALAETILPGVCDGDDLARRIDSVLASGQGDGWRLADLPPDGASWGMALDALAERGFAELDDEDRAALVHGIGDGDGVLTAAQMQLWFAEARAEIARQWMALPATMALIGYDGFAVGGDGDRKQGYRLTAADTIEPWQTPPGAVA